MTPKTPKKSMSSTSRGCQPVSRFCRARILPSTTKSTKPTRYISPYQRTASGPTLKATGSNCGWTSSDDRRERTARRALLGSGDYTREVSPVPYNRRSRIITQGFARSPNRAMLRAVGFDDGDFDKPIVGVANGHSTMNPCNAGIQPLVDRAMAALKSADAKPQVFGFPTVTDGIGMGTEGMKYSLVSREVIADAIEVAVMGQCMDGVLCVGGCDKNMPGAMMALARMNVPGIFVYAGTIKPGMWKGQTLTIVSPFEAVGAFAAGKMSREDYDGIARHACPTVGACGGQYTANTMSSSFEALGTSLLGSSQMASPDPEKADSAAASARALVNAVKIDLKSRDIITRDAIENAVSLVMATGGSTNAVLHYLAIASAAEVEWTIDDFERVRRKVPVLCDLKPSGRFVATDFHAAGGVPQVLRILLDHGVLHGDCMTITGRTLAEELAGVPDAPRGD